jgi:sulfotransferase family protein
MNEIDVVSGTRIDTYVVAGHPRSGTSMMMRALAEGGLSADYSAALDGLAANENGYIQNPNGFYELSLEDQMHPWFPMRHWGRLIKVQYIQLVGLAPGRYRVVFMMRHPREIRLSYQAQGEATARQRLGWVREEDYEPLMRRFMAAAALRADMQVLEVRYADVLADPRSAFERIRDFGFPIDPVRSARTIDPTLYRHRVAMGGRPGTGEEGDTWTRCPSPRP